MSFLSTPDVVLVFSPGRAGTAYLTRIFNTVDGCLATHEAKPTLSEPEFAGGLLDDVALGNLCEAKVNEILLCKKNAGASVYLESNHCLLHRHWKLFLTTLMMHTQGEIAVIILERDPLDVVKSRLRLGHGSKYQKGGQTFFRGFGWIYAPDSMDIETASPLEIMCGYVNTVRSMKEEFKRWAEGEKRIDVVEISMKQLNDLAQVEELIRRFGLTPDRSQLEEVVGERVNERAADKQSAASHTGRVVIPDDEEIKEALGMTGGVLGRRSNIIHTTTVVQRKSKMSKAVSHLQLIGPILLVVVLTGVLTTALRPSLTSAFTYLEENKPWSIVLFSFLYFVWVTCCLSKTPVSIASGYIFGFCMGFLIALVGMMLAVLFCTWVVRHSGCVKRNKVKSWLLNKYTGVRVANQMMKMRPLGASVLLRFMYVPSWLKNYGLAVLDVPIKELLIAGLASSTLYCAAFCYIGSTIDELANVISGKTTSGSAGNNVKIAVMVGSVVLTVLVLVGFGVRIRRYVKEEEKKLEEENSSELSKFPV